MLGNNANKEALKNIKSNMSLNLYDMANHENVILDFSKLYIRQIEIIELTDDDGYTIGYTIHYICWGSGEYESKETYQSRLDATKAMTYITNQYNKYCDEVCRI